MRVTEQIDALEVMGVNSVGYLIGPKIIASLFIFPIVIMYSMFFDFLEVVWYALPKLYLLNSMLKELDHFLKKISDTYVMH